MGVGAVGVAEPGCGVGCAVCGDGGEVGFEGVGADGEGCIGGCVEC